MARLVVKNGHKKNKCCNEIKLCVQDIDIIIGSLDSHNWEGCLKSKCIFTLFSCDLHISPPNMELVCGFGNAHNSTKKLSGEREGIITYELTSRPSNIKPLVGFLSIHLT